MPLARLHFGCISCTAESEAYWRFYSRLLQGCTLIVQVVELNLRLTGDFSLSAYEGVIVICHFLAGT